MAGKSREKATGTVSAAAVDIGDEQTAASESELARRKLRERWELASVLNFLSVFEPLIESNLKVSAEEIEMALINPNNLLSELHIVLLKGIPTVSKTLNRPDAWVTAVCKKLSEWWPWVAEGDLPLTLAKGEEISKYKELDPTNRLMILKALCEIRASQGDTLAYITDALKSGSELSTFRKDRLCGNENGISYWLDGNATIGYRLYREVYKFDSELKVKGKRIIQPVNCHWETLATNLEEIRKVAGDFSSSKVKMEVSVSKTVETDVIPVLEKLHKKKERYLKQQQREKMLISGFRNSGITRTCRNRRPATYTFDAFDKAIDEAITMQQSRTKKRKTTKEQGLVEKRGDNRNKNRTALHESSDADMKSGDSESSDSETESDGLQDEGDDENNDGEFNDEKNDAGSEDGIASNTSDEKNDTGSEDGSASNTADEKNDVRSEDGSASNTSNENNDTLDEDESVSNTSDEKNVTGSEDGRASNTSDEKNETGSEDGSASNTLDEENNLGDNNYARVGRRPKVSCLSKRVAGVAKSPAPKLRNQGAKNRLRQRPTHNTAFKSAVVPDSEDESSPETLSDKSSSSESGSPASDPGDDSDSRRTSN